MWVTGIGAKWQQETLRQPLDWLSGQGYNCSNRMCIYSLTFGLPNANIYWEKYRYAFLRINKRDMILVKVGCTTQQIIHNNTMEK